MMNDDLISRQAEIECLKTKIAEIFFKETAEKNVEKWLNELPTVQPEQKMGEWVYGEFDIPHCSICGHDVMPNMVSPYCPNCGAKMGENSNDK